MAIVEAGTSDDPISGEGPTPIVPASARASRPRGVRRLGLPALVLLTAAAAYVAVPRPGTLWDAAPTWVPAALGVGLLLHAPRRWRPWLLANLGVLHVLGWVAAGATWTTAIGFGLALALAAGVTHARLTAGLPRARLLDEGDVSRVIGSAALGAGAAAAVVAATLGLAGTLTVGALLSVFLGTAAAMVVLVPLFLPGRAPLVLAGRVERVTAAGITVATSLLVFSDLVPAPVAFAVMPMFAWHAFRGSLREASWLLVTVGVIATSTTWAGVGPMAQLAQRWDLSTSEVDAVLQLFLLDCGLILLPIAVVVAQHRQAVAVATAERHRWRGLVQSARGTAIVVADEVGVITVVNPAAEQLWGTGSSELVGLPLDVLCAPAEVRRLAQELDCAADLATVCAATVAAGLPDHTWRLTHRDGTERVGLLTVSQVRDEAGLPGGHLLTIVDVTERENARVALAESLAHEQAAARRLRELERVKGDFVATVSHELRTPIASIIGYTELLADGEVGDLPPAQRDVVERVDRNGRRLLTLVEDLLTLSEIETSRLRLVPERTDLCTVARTTYDVMRTLLTERDLDVVLALPPHPVVVEADPVQLRRALTKLLDNAVKFTADGGRVVLRVGYVGDGAEMVVTDSGVGLDDVSVDAAFERFSRGSAAIDQAVQGAGLGLTIVQAVVSLHGGRVQLVPATGGGTEVRVRLPLRVPGASRPLPSQSRAD